jgi:hypothetical protein
VIRTALDTGTLIGRGRGRVRYLCLPRLMEELSLAHGDAQRRDMHELLDDRYGNRSLVTS